MKWRQIKRAFAMFRAGRFGDAAVLKADAMEMRAAPALEAELADVRGYLPRIDLERLRRLPAGSFGRAYVEFLDQRGLQPLTISPELAEEVARNVYAVRYAATHDMFHTLLGFDTTLAGEAGVYAFSAEQGYVRRGHAILALAQVVYTLRQPWQFRRIRAAVRRGRELGARARLLLAFRFEEHWERPLAELQAELGLPPTGAMA